MSEEVSWLIIAMIFLVVIWLRLVLVHQRREVEMAKELRQIFLGTVRPPPQPPIELSLQLICLRVSSVHKFAVRRFLLALVKAGYMSCRKGEWIGQKRRVEFYALTEAGLKAFQNPPPPS